MDRDLYYRIAFGDEEQRCLVREMSLEDGQDVRENYIVEGNSRGVHFSLAELAELRAAIDEMLRMAEQHRDALTDGAGERVAEAEWGIGVAETRILQALVDGSRLCFNTIRIEWSLEGKGHVNLYWATELANKDLIESISQTEPPAPGRTFYDISDAGRRALAAQTPEAESEPAPDEALVLNRAEKEILRALAHGDALWLKNDRAGLYGAEASVKEASIKSLWDRRLIGPGDEPANMVDGMEDGLLW